MKAREQPQRNGSSMMDGNLSSHMMDSNSGLSGSSLMGNGDSNYINSTNNNNYYNDNDMSNINTKFDTNSTKFDWSQHVAECQNQSSISPKYIIILEKEYPLDHAIIVFGYLMPAVVVFSIVTNLLVVIILTRHHMRNATNVVLCTLAVVDLLTIVFGAPLYFYIYTLGHYKVEMERFICRVFHLLTDTIPMLLHNASIWLTLLLAGQRYIYIQYPAIASSWCTQQRIKLCVGIILSLAFISQSTRFFDIKYDLVKLENKTSLGTDCIVCREEVQSWVMAANIDFYFGAYFAFRILFVYLFPCIALITLNCLLYRALKRAERRRRILLKSQPKSGRDEPSQIQQSNQLNSINNTVDQKQKHQQQQKQKQGQQQQQQEKRHSTNTNHQHHHQNYHHQHQHKTLSRGEPMRGAIGTIEAESTSLMLDSFSKELPRDERSLLTTRLGVGFRSSCKEQQSKQDRETGASGIEAAATTTTTTTGLAEELGKRTGNCFGERNSSTTIDDQPNRTQSFLKINGFGCHSEASAGQEVPSSERTISCLVGSGATIQESDDNAVCFCSFDCECLSEGIECSSHCELSKLEHSCQNRGELSVLSHSSDSTNQVVSPTSHFHEQVRFTITREEDSLEKGEQESKLGCPKVKGMSRCETADIGNEYEYDDNEDDDNEGEGEEGIEEIVELPISRFTPRSVVSNLSGLCHKGVARSDRDPSFSDMTSSRYESTNSQRRVKPMISQRQQQQQTSKRYENNLGPQSVGLTTSVSQLNTNDLKRESVSWAKRCSRRRDSNRTTLMLIVVVSVFLLVEVPSAIVTTLHVVGTTFGIIGNSPDWKLFISYTKLYGNFLIMVSHSFNFYIYCSMSNMFRQTFWNLLTPNRTERDELRSFHSQV